MIAVRSAMTPLVDPAPSPFQIPNTVKTPIPPRIKPTICWAAIFSDLKKIKRNIRVDNGVQALIIPARTVVTSCWAYANKNPGKTFRSSETTQRINQVLESVGSLMPRIFTISNRIIAPRAHLPKATPTGFRNSSPNLIKTKEDPQTKPSSK